MVYLIHNEKCKLNKNGYHISTLTNRENIKVGVQRDDTRTFKTELKEKSGNYLSPKGRGSCYMRVSIFKQ